MELVTGLDALAQVTLGCVNAFSDLVGSIGDIITALLVEFNGTEYVEVALESFAR